MKPIFLCGALMLAALLTNAGAASAFTAQISPAGAITAASLGLTTFNFFGSEFACSYTLRGELNRSVTLTSSASAGTITSARAANCSNSTALTFLNLPYAIVYQEAAGGAPDNLTGFTLAVQGYSFLIPVFGGFINCLYRGTVPWPIELTDTGTNTYTTALFELLGEPPLRRSSGAGCQSEVELIGPFSLTTQTVTVS